MLVSVKVILTVYHFNTSIYFTNCFMLISLYSNKVFLFFLIGGSGHLTLGNAPTCGPMARPFTNSLCGVKGKGKETEAALKLGGVWADYNYYSAE